VFHARLAEEEPGAQRWDIDDVAAGLVAKLVRRHPHVFGDVVARDAGEVAANWDVIKAAEKGRASVTEGVPMALPALVLAETLQRKAAELGMPADLLEDDDALWSAVVACRAEGIDAEADLRTRAKRFRDRLAAVELAAGAEGRNPREFSADEWRARWQQPAESRR
jgi:XTP/dITP diphosphohydrolase